MKDRQKKLEERKKRKEGKRIQTMPDDYILKGDFKEQWRQIGNAVPSKMAEIIAKKIKEMYFDE